MPITPSDLRAVPLFHDITDGHLGELVAAFERREVPAGEVLFEAGTMPTHFLLLVGGEVALFDAGEVRFRLRPIAPIAELGPLTGLRRTVSARTTAPSEILRLATGTLFQFFEQHGDVAFPFYHNLLRIVADKVKRDERRLDEMRTNIIRTQKAMKQLRDLVLEHEETPLSRPIFDTLDGLIAHNRKLHYMVRPPPALRTAARLDDGTVVEVTEMSDTALRLAIPGDSTAPAVGSPWTGVLILHDAEIPVSGRVERAEGDGILIELGPFIQEYADRLQDHLTRLQLLDYVV